jgi:UDP-N-acetylglucosamine diphosphorylase / glucose-1-phosphate thymidylyltransferase / UDP-N-acetylgalactosamine diphosphorylase / glucosamine-1-phosphate N-acetyltransferase / galactosamine-1-phosphate N-acetyltransferase
MRVIDEQIAGFRTSVLGEFSDSAPWELTLGSIKIVERLLNRLGGGYAVSGNVAVHQTSIIEDGAIIKGPAIIGPDCFIAAGAYVRGGCWLEANCILGPGTELKSSFVFGASKLAHFNFVGDSILGCEVNLEAGSIIANRRNEWADPTISFSHRGRRIETGAEKFGALVGDRTKIGANAVIAPGAILAPATIVKRLSLVDQGVDMRVA